MKTREQIMKELKYQERLLHSAQTSGDKVRELEIRNIIQGLIWVLGTNNFAEERNYVENDKIQCEILMLKAQLESAEDKKEFLQTVLDAYKDAYQDLKTRYKELDNKYQAVVNNHGTDSACLNKCYKGKVMIEDDVQLISNYKRLFRGIIKDITNTHIAIQCKRETLIFPHETIKDIILIRRLKSV